MRRRQEEEDRCSYISRIPEETVDSQFGCLCTGVAAVLILILVFLFSGCSTCYVALLRHEYNKNGVAEGVYHGKEEYPALFPATRIAVGVEIQTWWSPSDMKLGRDYQRMLWPFGAVMALIDVPISVISDLVMLPYDILKTSAKETVEET